MNINTTHKQISDAFALWERGYRDVPGGFLTREEVVAMEIAELSERQAIYFIALLRQVS